VLRAAHETIKITQRQERLYMQELVLVYTTWPDAAAAEEAGRALVEARLAACANILPGMVSLYRWQGALERAQEAVLILKTRRDLARSLTAAVRERHPYEVPAILVLTVDDAEPAFAQWIADETAAAS